MTDREMREAERAAKSGTAADKARYLVARLRAGLDPERVAAAASLGHAGLDQNSDQVIADIFAPNWRDAWWHKATKHRIDLLDTKEKRSLSKYITTRKNKLHKDGIAYKTSIPVTMTQPVEIMMWLIYLLEMGPTHQHRDRAILESKAFQDKIASLLLWGKINGP